MEPEIVIFVGLQASGKSTYDRSHYASTQEHVSKDLFPRSAQREKRQIEQVPEALRAGRSVVVDNTNPTREVRLPLIELGKAAGAKVIGINFECTVKGALIRNRTREGPARVPDVAIIMTSEKLKPARLEEDFNEIRTVTIEEPSPQRSLF